MFRFRFTIIIQVLWFWITCRRNVDAEQTPWQVMNLTLYVYLVIVWIETDVVFIAARSTGEGLTISFFSYPMNPVMASMASIAILAFYAFSISPITTNVHIFLAWHLKFTSMPFVLRTVDSPKSQACRTLDYSQRNDKKMESFIQLFRSQIVETSRQCDHVIHIIFRRHLNFHSECQRQQGASSRGGQTRVRHKMKYSRPSSLRRFFIAAMCKACKKITRDLLFYLGPSPRDGMRWW